MFFIPYVKHISRVVIASFVWMNVHTAIVATSEELIVHSGNYVIRPMQMGDLYAVLQIYSDPKSMKFMAACDGKTYDAQCVEAFVKDLVTKNSEVPLREVTLAIVKEKKVIGYLSLSNLLAENNPELACCIIPNEQNKGIASSLKTVVIELLDKLKVRSLDVLVHFQNVASKRVLEKTGFSFVRQENLEGCDGIMERYTATSE